MNEADYYFICGDYLKDDTFFDLEQYIYDVIKPAQQFQPTAQVRVSKQVAGILGMKKAQATTILVDKKTLNAVKKKFNIDGKTLGVLSLVDFRKVA